LRRAEPVETISTKSEGKRPVCFRRIARFGKTFFPSTAIPQITKRIDNRGTRRISSSPGSSFQITLIPTSLPAAERKAAAKSPRNPAVKPML